MTDMTRRTIGKLIAATAALLGLPALTKAATIVEPVAPEPVPQTVAELTAWVEQHFDCKQGDPRAFTMHMPDRPDAPAVQAIGESERVPHFVLQVGARNGTEAQVIAHLHSEFVRLLVTMTYAGVKRPRLYWRTPITVIEEEELIFGPQAVWRVDVEDGLATIPAGWALDQRYYDHPQSNYRGGEAYRPVTGRNKLIKARARIGIYGLQKWDRAHPDGAPSTFI